MSIKESTIHTRAVFHGEHHRLLLEKIWDEKLPKVAICMSNAGVTPSIYHMDYTTLFCINALSALGYGSCSIVNLFSKMTNKLNLTGNLSDLTCPENEEQIINVAKSCDIFLWSVGSIATTHKKITPYKDSLFRRLIPYKDKIHVIVDSTGREGLHPLSPSLRNKPWTIIPYRPEPLPADKKEVREDAVGGQDALASKQKKK